MFISILVNVFDESGAVDSGGAPPEIWAKRGEV